MDEKSLQIIKEHSDIRKCIVEHLEEAVSILENVGENCEDHKIWYLAPGIPVEKIEEVICQLRYIIKGTTSVVPEIRNESSKQKQKKNL